MDVVLALELRARRAAGGRPPGWDADERLKDLAGADEAISAIRDCGPRSDDVLSALLALSTSDPGAAVVVHAALLRLGLGRCRRDPAKVDALLGELAIAVAEARGGIIPPSSRRLAGVIVDRAWGRVRWAEMKGRSRFLVVDPTSIPERVDPATYAATEAIEASVAIAQLRAELAAEVMRDRRRRKVVRAWDCVLTAGDASERTVSDNNRRGHAQRVLRRLISVDLELLDEPA